MCNQYLLQKAAKVATEKANNKEVETKSPSNNNNKAVEVKPPVNESESNENSSASEASSSSSSDNDESSSESISSDETVKVKPPAKKVNKTAITKDNKPQFDLQLFFKCSDDKEEAESTKSEEWQPWNTALVAFCHANWHLNP